MSVRTLDTNSNNDIYASARGLAVAEGLDAMRVILEASVNTHKSELQFDEGRGIDYFGTVYQNRNYLGVWAGQVKALVRSLGWVREIKEYNYSFNQDTNSVEWSMALLTNSNEILLAQSQGQTFVKTQGDGLYGVRWEDIVDKPAGIAETVETIRKLKWALHTDTMKHDLNDLDTLGNTKDKLNEVKNTLINALPTA